MNDIVRLINNLIGQYWLLGIFGVIHIAYLERRFLSQLVQLTPTDRKSKGTLASHPWTPLLRRFVYLIGGGLLGLSAWALTQFLLASFASAPTEVSSAETGPFAFARAQLNTLGAFMVYGFVLAGGCLILSAGTRWLVNLAKVLVTATVLYMFLILFFASIPTR